MMMVYLLVIILYNKYFKIIYLLFIHVTFIFILYDVLTTYLCILLNVCVDGSCKLDPCHGSGHGI